MFKRANKMTALLVAAASIMSVVPAMADDSASARLASKDGHITNAVAYKDGKYVYQGYKSDDDSDSVYYNGGDADKELDDVSDASVDNAYSDKYALANDGSDQYLVDLTSGDVTDDTTPKDDIDTAATKLQTKLNKTDRYKKGTDVPVTSSYLGDESANNGVYTIPGNKFGDAWYSYGVYPSTGNTDAAKYQGADYKLYGFTDANGKYVDASYTANIYAYSTAEGKTVKIENYSNSADDADSDSKLLATLVKQPVALTQDADYIYALTTVAITDYASGVVTTGDTTTQGVVANLKSSSGGQGSTTIRTYVQKIAKAQGDQKDDAYLPKTVESYEVGNADGNEYDCGDAKDAYNGIKDSLSAAGHSVSSLQDVTADDVVVRLDNGTTKPVFSISDGNLVAVKATTNDSIDGITLKFKKDKVKYKTTLPVKTSGTTTTSVDSKTKFDQYLLEKDSDDSVDVDSDQDAALAYDFDADGNLWVVADGKIYQYKSGGSMTKTYTCDSSMDAISAYDANSIFTWQVDGDIYTTVTEGETAATNDTPQATAPVQSGWVQLADGSWNYYDATGSKVASNWVNPNGVWYYLNANGAMATGWAQVGGTWYYMNTSGAMQTGWVQAGSSWYYLASSGAMQTGWVNDNGSWYYCDSTGAMLSNTTVDGYALGSNGAWVQ